MFSYVQAPIKLQFYWGKHFDTLRAKKRNILQFLLIARVGSRMARPIELRFERGLLAVCTYARTEETHFAYCATSLLAKRSLVELLEVCTYAQPQEI